ncbi:hybrid sensor histidine kinase/response regulator transcription factor [Filimonas effusa]|uniref:histidine kinase n=1 Tax=Filimonas effusa TaxID=2508721 RepID=A0A4V1MA36_9BACT|nr:two-component regulator propeller domain-containing protein [Filimonas effusa]RXK83804.1 response regulator [Filimonas effusa]
MSLLSKTISWLALSFILSHNLKAQQEKYQFARINNQQGLSHNQVNAIIKDVQGFIWIGTMSGLNRFDGYNFKTFHQNPNDNTSLSDNFIVNLFNAPGNTLWIHTASGASLFNPASNRFSRNTNTLLQQWNLPVDTVRNIIKDQKETYWFLYRSGLYSYPGNRKLRIPGIAAFTFDTQQNLWLVYQNGRIESRDRNNLKLLFRSDTLTHLSSAAANWLLFADSQNDLWLAAGAGPRGAWCFSPASRNLLHFNKEAKQHKLTADIVVGFTQDNNGAVWISTDHGGVTLVNKKDFSVQWLLNDPNDDKTLSQNSISAVYKDPAGIIWLGTYKKGACFYNESLFKFPVVKNRPADPHSLPYEDVNRFAEDTKGNWWIGTNGGGLIYYNRKQGSFKQYKHNPTDNNSLCNDVVVSLCIDHNQKLWIGTFFGGLDCFDGKTFTHYRHNPANPNSIADNNIWELYEDKNKNLWIGTLSSGVDQLDSSRRNFIHFPPGKKNGLADTYIAAILQDKQQNLWFGTAKGIDVLNTTTGNFTHYQHEPGHTISLANNLVLDLRQDSRGLIWAATREGLSIFDPSVNKFIATLRKEDGLPDNVVLTILEDNQQQVWISTPSGIGNISVYKNKNGAYQFRHRNFDELNNLQAHEFNENAALKTAAGELVFGGPAGFNIFDPAQVRLAKSQAPIALTDFLVFNKSVQAGDTLNGRVLLTKTISATDTIRLRYKEKDFAIEFAELGFAQSAKDEYAYKLEGFNKEWVVTNGSQRRASYTNLDAGTYRFKVKAADGNGGWNEKETALTIIISPAFWNTWIAFLLYALFILLVLMAARRIIVARTRLKFRIEQQQKEAQHLHAIDMMKIRFFTNISHEFRTPLSLILAPLDKVINAAEGEKKKQLELIRRNAKRLLGLVNQLLDFRKLETQEFKFIPAEADIISFTKEVVTSFSDIAEKKDITLSFSSEIPGFPTRFDKDKLEKVLFNLLSNAFKFTPQQGQVSVDITAAATSSMVPSSSGVIQGNMPVEMPGPGNAPVAAGLQPASVTTLRISVRDSGIGIAPEEQDRIFERFFQVDTADAVINQGSGIGLAITREFVKLHNGTITVTSEVNKGSCFTIALPLPMIENNALKSPENNSLLLPAITSREYAPGTKQAETNPPETGQPELLYPESENPEPEEPLIGKTSRKNKLLLVEDNEDFRFYLKDNLGVYFTIIEAANGKEGWQQVQSQHPDLVVTDIMMPLMNGLELARKVRNDPRTSHIPVVLLTAMATEEQQLAGFETGANDYITKPFNFEILLSRLRNLLAQRKQIRREFRKKLEINPAEIAVTPVDEQFMKQALAVVEQNIGNTNFSVEELSRSLHISRVALYKKLLSLTGKTPIEFIRIMRLKRAALLLSKAQLTVAEVAYEVGFNDPKNFARYFKEEYGVLPSKYKAG